MPWWTERLHTDAKLGEIVVFHGVEADYAVPERLTAHIDGEGGQPDLRLECAMVDGQPLVYEVHIVASPDRGRTIRDADLVRLVLDKIAVDAFTQLGMIIEPVNDHGDFMATPLAYDRGERDLRTTITANPRDAELQRVAEVYQRYAATQPSKFVATVLGYTPRTAHRRIKQAEEAGYLPATTRGRKRV
jgi:hypothetical protein